MTGFTLFHVLLSVAGILAGFFVVSGLLRGQRLDLWTAVFLATNVATNVTGFGFAFDQLLPSHYTAILALILLAIAIVARYVMRLSGAWSWIYAVSAVLALYLNVFVLVVQLFRRVPSLEALAPTQTEPAFLLTQSVVLAAFALLTIAAGVRFKSVH